MQRLSTIALALVAAVPFGCGGSGNDGAPPQTAADASEDATDDGGAEASSTIEAGAPSEASTLDYGAPSSTFPAFPPDVGQIQYNAGYVMTTPVIVPITWDVDGSQASFDVFASHIGVTGYFKATTGEYGVMAAVSAPPVHLTGAAPAQLEDTDLQNMIKANAGVVDADAGSSVDAGDDGGSDEGGATPAWPAPTPNTIYAFFLPPKTSLVLTAAQGGAGDACSQGIGGYHDQVTVGGVTTAYAVVPSCQFSYDLSAHDQSTTSMSHEIVEASTDPQPNAKFNGWTGFDPDHFAFDWYQQFQSELADACEFFPSSTYEDQEKTPPFDFYVQRTWSNQSAAAGHDPCVPGLAGPYFNVTPMDLTYVSVTLPTYVTGASGPEVVTTKGMRILPGHTGALAFGFYSDGPTGGPWTVSASEGDGTGRDSNAGNLTVTIDKPSGQNGEKAYATVSVSSAGPYKAELLTLQSTLNGVSHVMPVVISSE